MTIQQFIFPQNQSQHDMREEWISHLIHVNRVGINRILNRYGYSGSLQPETREDTVVAIEMLIEQNGTDAIRDLLMVQPEFEAIRQLLTPKAKPFYRIPINQTFTQVSPVKALPATMQNATGDTEAQTILSIPVDHVVKGAIVFALLYLLTSSKT